MSVSRSIYYIEDGPDRETLIDAFKYAYDKNARIPVDFTLVSDNSPTDISGDTALLVIKRAKITGLDHEKGDGYSFIIKGYMYPRQKNLYGGIIVKTKHQFTACYDAQTRKGRAVVSI